VPIIKPERRKDKKIINSTNTSKLQKIKNHRKEQPFTGKEKIN
jgi:hypothetical protein